MTSDERRSSPHVARNHQPIIEAIGPALPEVGLVLEIASGTGEHAVHLARAFPKLLWQPSDPEPTALRSIDAWRSEAGLFNLLPAMSLDVRAAHWPVPQAEAILCINMVHISPWAATLALLRGAGRLLEAGSPLFLYGPFFQQGVETAPSNLRFDSDLRARNPQWGLRDVEAVERDAQAQNLVLETVTSMPANNLILQFRRI